MDKKEFEPPRFSKFLLNFDKLISQQKDLDLLQYERKNQKRHGFHQDEESKFSFEIFVSSNVWISGPERSKLTRAYKGFVGGVSSFINDSQNNDNNATLIMYNIMKNNLENGNVTNDTQIETKIKNYFGKKLTTASKLELRKLAKELLAAEKKYGRGRLFNDKEFHGNIQWSKEHKNKLKNESNQRIKIKADSKIHSQNEQFPSSNSNSNSNSNKKNALTKNQQTYLWLNKLCQEHTTKVGLADGGLSADSLTTELISLCKKCNEVELQMKLFELCGETGLEFMMEIAQKQGEISESDSNINRERAQAWETNTNINTNTTIASATTTSSTMTASSSYDDFTQQTDLMDVESDFIDYTAKDTDEEASLRLAMALEQQDNYITNGEDTSLMTQNQRNKYEKKKEKERQQLEALEKESNPFYDPSLSFLNDAGFDLQYLEQERALGLHSTAGSVDTWQENIAPKGSLEYQEIKKLSVERKQGQGFEEIFIKAPKRPTSVEENDLISINSLESWAQLAFPDTKRLNRIQSEVFEVAYKSLENMMVCAPTGAGKTNIAMLTFLAHVKQHISDGGVDMDSIKAVYIAPMKALAQEVVEKFGKRLKPLGMMVREFTGDMQLTRQEVASSQLIVTTPEKWDVITRKGGDGSLGSLTQLIIIDEVHLLADDRGAVIETIVARTHRQVETYQSPVRIVGLSATLPNYRDVADFLRVSAAPGGGLFHFGPEYRPVSLDQTLIGVTEKNRIKAKEAMNKQCFDKLVEALKNGKQVMVFVHSRKETGSSAEALNDLAGKNQLRHLFDCTQHEQYNMWSKEVQKSRSREVQQNFEAGFGTHHAGMLRSDRSLTEKLFERGVIKVLCCTATLAWGVNLPAHTVIIKGTEMYDPEKGGFVDIGILDVLQIFGRAGRPQYDTCGHGILITQHKSLGTYLDRLAHQAPIESALIKALPDHMNAEIVNGTINNLKEAAAWLSYTFLFIRLRKNPVAYGMHLEERYDDPQLLNKRFELVKDAAKTLDHCMMIRFDIRSDNLAATDLGRIASHFYIKHETIDAFNSMLGAHIAYSEALHVLCSSSEFDQLKLRPEELSEVDNLKSNTKVKVRAPVEDTAGKVNVLLQSYIQNSRVSSFTLQSDSNFVAQNAARIARALFEIALKRGWSKQALHFLRLANCVDRRMHAGQSPLRQFEDLPYEVIKRLEADNISLEQLIQMTPGEIGAYVHNKKIGSKVLTLVQKIPWLEVQSTLQPITRGILRIILDVTAAFTWDDRYHGMAESFWLWVEDSDGEYIYHSEYLLLQKKQRFEGRKLEFTIPIREPLPSQYFVRIISDRWVGSEDTVALSFKHLLLPDLEYGSAASRHTELLDLHPLPLTALRDPRFERLYEGKFTHFNPVQTQTFHTLYNTDGNVLVGAPTGSGKTIMGELAILRLLKKNPRAKTVYVAPLKALARERVKDWRVKLKVLGLRVEELSGDITPDMSRLKDANVIITTPEKWDGVSRGWARREYVTQVELLLIDEIHLLGVDRGPVIEVIVSRMQYIAAQTRKHIRIVGLSTALANAQDLGDWMGITEGGGGEGHGAVFNFRASVRPVPMTIHIRGFPEKNYCPRMATMNKPAYAAILEHSPTKPVLIFVSSRRQTRLTALDLISHCAADDEAPNFLHMPEDDARTISSTITDTALKDTLVFGVGIHHAGLNDDDRRTVEQLFCDGKIQILVCTSTLAWGVNFPAHLVIVKGTEFFDGKIGRYVDFPVTDVLQMMGRAGRPQFDDSGVACIFVHEPKKVFYKKFLHEPFPVESSLHLQMHNHINAEVASGSITSIADCVEWISYTYLFRRLIANPSYYGLSATDSNVVEQHLTKLITSVVEDLDKAGCVKVTDEFYVTPTSFGSVASFYYLDWRSIALIRKRLDTWHVHGINNSTNAVVTLASINSSSESSTISTTFGDAIEGNKDYTNNIPAASASSLAQFQALMQLVSDCQEFAELPVRHNEEILNGQLAEDCPWPVDPDLLDSAHCKTYLLIQAYLYRINLPISDYINDTKSVIDQLPRVVNAIMDIGRDRRIPWLITSCSIAQQTIVQALPPDADSSRLLKQLPYMSDIYVKALRKASINNLYQLSLMSEEQRRQTLVNVLNIDKSNGCNGDNNNHNKIDKNDRGSNRNHHYNRSGTSSDMKLIQSALDIPYYKSMIRFVYNNSTFVDDINGDSDTGSIDMNGTTTSIAATDWIHLDDQGKEKTHIDINCSAISTTSFSTTSLYLEIKLVKKGGNERAAIHTPKYHRQVRGFGTTLLVHHESLNFFDNDCTTAGTGNYEYLSSASLFSMKRVGLMSQTKSESSIMKIKLISDLQKYQEMERKTKPKGTGEGSRAGTWYVQLLFDCMIGLDKMNKFQLNLL